MTSVKKIDWLRHLYYEATKWTHSLTGQVKWSELKVKDPNNGSKMTVGDLEKALPNMLKNCLDKDQVPFEYRPEVMEFMSYVKKGEKFNNKSVSDLVKTRKEVVGLIETFENFSKLSDADKATLMSKIDEHELVSLLRVVQSVKTKLQGLGIQNGTGSVGDGEEDRCSKFKMIDWLRHMYVMCQKWLNNKQGQLQWKKLKAQDPNNSKDGNRMKMDELKESLKILVPSLDDHSVPRAYHWEVNQIRKVLCHEDGDFSKESLEAGENLRKTTIKTVETLLHLEDLQVLFAMAPTKLPWVLDVVIDIEKLFTKSGDVEDDAVETDFLENEIIMEEGDAEREKEEDLETPTWEDESDGTEYLMKYFEEAPQGQETVSILGNDTSSLESPVSPSSGSEVFSEVSSPASQSHHRWSVEDYLSDDSGFYSPQSNPLDLEDAEKLDEIDLNLINDLDFSTLPDVEVSDMDEDLFLSDIEPEYASGSNSRKRKFSEECFEGPVVKRAKP